MPLRSKSPRSRLQPLNIATPSVTSTSPRTSLDFDTPETPPPTRSLSDGDLSDYLKGFSQILATITSAKSACNSEMSRILTDLPSEKSGEFESTCLELKETIIHIQSYEISTLILPGTCKRILQKILALHSVWQKTAPPSTEDCIVRLLLSFSNVARLVEHLEEDARVWMYAIGRFKKRPVPPSGHPISQNVMLETDSTGNCIYISPSCVNVFGFESREIVKTDPIPFLVDLDTFASGYKALAEGNGEGTVEIEYIAKRKDKKRLKMEAKGMLAKGCVLWVTRPVTGELLSDAEGEVVPTVTDLILCHICERSIPAIFFQQHNELCSIVHRAEMEVGNVNDELKAARKSLLERNVLLEREMENFSGNQGREDGVDDVVVYAYLTKLLGMGRDIVAAVNRALDSVLKDSDSPPQVWKCPAEHLFYPPRLEETVSEGWPGSTLVDAALSEIGSGIYNIGMLVESLLEARNTTAEAYMKNSVRYNELTIQEEKLKQECLNDSDGSSESENNEKSGSDTNVKDKESDISSAGISENSLKNPLVSASSTALAMGDLSNFRISIPERSNSPSGSTHLSTGSLDRESAPWEVEDGRASLDGRGSLADSEGDATSDGGKKPKDTLRKRRKSSKLKAMMSINRSNESLSAHISPTSSLSNLPSGSQSPRRKMSMRPTRLVVSKDKVVDVEQGPTSPFPSSPLTASVKGGYFSQEDTGGSVASSSSPYMPPLQLSSPQMGTGAPQSAVPRSQPSIRDYEILKPISKGAFGAVYLARKRLTGDHFAIKV